VTQALDSGVLSFVAKGERRLQFSAAPIAEYLERIAALPWGRHRRVRNLICPATDDDIAESSAGRTIRRDFDRVAVALEMDPAELYAHRFRHTYATLYLQQMAGDPEAVFKLQQQMGWARLDTAANYLRRSRRAELDEVEQNMFSKLPKKSRNE
jgi:integrase